MAHRVFYPVMIAAAAFLSVSLTGRSDQQLAHEAVRIDNDDIGGVVASAKGPEAGVWVIAETTELPAKFVKIVVTDDGGRYVLPQLPKANYKVWVRGYGLVDSQQVQATPGKVVNLNAAVAPNARAAAEYYPAIYWFSLLRVPDKSEFPGTGPKGHARDSKEPGPFRLVDRGLGATHTLGTSRQQHGQRPRPARPRASIADVRGLDRAHRCRRIAAHTSETARYRAKHRHYRVGLGRS